MNWRFINTGFNDCAYNMATDEAIMKCVAEGMAPPTLRFYGWKPAAVSLGYFQSARKEVDMEACRNNRIGVVRRLTGGRAILHDLELTYSVIIPENYPDMPMSVTESYKILSTGLQEGLAQLGIESRLAPVVNFKPGEHTSGACFDAPSSYELVVDGKKLVGSAQVRKKGVILQHGSILNELNADKLFSCLAFSNQETKERAKRFFISKAISIKDVLGEPVKWDDLCGAFYKGFEKGMNITLEPDEQLLGEEKKHIEELCGKYSSDEWNFSR